MAKALMKLQAGEGGVELRDFDTPDPGPGEVQMEVAVAGICGTDLHIINGDWPMTPPVVMGHELSGTIVHAGPGVDPGRIGDRVVPEVFVTDETCTYCRAGHRSQCADRRSIGAKIHGGFTSLVNVRAANTHLIPPGTPFTAAVLAEPLACVLGAISNPPVIAAGDRVLVSGPGTIGNLAAQVAQAAGAQVTLSGSRESDRLQTARSLGIQTHVSSRDARPDPAMVNRFDVVIECSGSEGAANAGLAAAAPNGTYVQLGIFGKPVTLDMDKVCVKQLTIRSGLGAAGQHIDRALALIASDAVLTEPLVTGVYPLDEWELVVRQIQDGKGLKFLFDPSLSTAEGGIGP